MLFRGQQRCPHFSLGARRDSSTCRAAGPHSNWSQSAGCSIRVRVAVDNHEKALRTALIVVHLQPNDSFTFLAEAHMTLLQEIEDGSSGDGMPTGTLLRKSLVLASRLGSQSAIDWINWELDGYPNDVPVPDYRFLSLTIKADLIDVAKRANGWTVPTAFLGKSSDNWTRIGYRNGVGAIEHLLSTADSSVHFSMSNLPLYLRTQKFTEMEIINAWGEASSSQLKHILDTARTRVLRFVLDLGKEYPDAGVLKSSTPKDADRVTQIFTNNIYGPANVVGTASHSNIVLNVMQGDFASLKQTLEENGVAAPDIDALKIALDSEMSPPKEGFGPKVAAWIGNMMKKSAEGTWKIATSAAGGLLGKALGRFYGLP
jgi:AbiTii